MRISEIIQRLEAKGDIRAAVSLANAAAGKPDREYPSLRSMCDDLFRTDVAPGRDSYGISPASNMYSFLDATGVWDEENGKEQNTI